MGSAAQLRAAAQVCQWDEDEDQQGGEEEYWAVIGQNIAILTCDWSEHGNTDL